ncbi:MAG: C4-dicarboxylate TRAP transporter substrate-binding protein [Thermomicrobiales bacterium]|nr:C4-dicarboxylate TRAP transporter substrate-binding protein [Thermomicrobiales bacterium]
MPSIVRVVRLVLSLTMAASGSTGWTQTPSAPVVLKIADFQPATASRPRLTRAWADDVEKRTQGKVKFEYFPAESLLKAAEIFEGTRSGVADIGIWVQAYNPAISPTLALFNLPGISPAFRPAIRASNELILTGDFGFFRDDLRKLGVEPLFSWGVSDQEIISTKPIPDLAALKGLKVRVIGREWPQLISGFGGTPVAMPWPEVYESLSRGTLDANVGFVSANRDAKLYEVAKHHSRINLGAPAGQLVIVNKRVWDGLPKDIQLAMREAGQRNFAENLAELYEKEMHDAIKEMEAKGVRFYSWDAANREKLHAAMSSLWDTWAKAMDAKGFPASEALRRYLELQKKNAH